MSCQCPVYLCKKKSMHELSVAARIIDIAEEKVKELGSGRVTKVEIEVGVLSGVVRENLVFAMELATKNTCLEKAEVDIIEIQARVRCKECMAEFEMIQFYDACPSCGSGTPEILTGQELRVRSLYIDE